MDAVSFLRAIALMVAPGLNMTLTGTPPLDPALLMTTEEICRDQGFQCETHTTITEDGYNITGHRILPAAPFKGAVLVMSGLNGCSDNFLLLGRQRSLASMMADAGYDVILGNQRGCTYSRGHRKWTRKDPQYWRYTLDDVGQYDLAALVKLTQRVTGERRIFYIGYSSGGNSFYTWLELVPEMRDTIRAAIMLAPGVYFTHQKDPLIRLFAALPDRLVKDLWQNPAEVMGRTRSLAELSWQVCRAGSPMRSTCEAIANLSVQINPVKSDFSRFDFFVAHGFCGTSTTASAQYVQNIKAKKFQAFDWGRKENLRRYGREAPPEFLLQNITIPIAIFQGKTDRFITLQDSILLSKVTSKNLGVLMVPLDDFNHIDYISHKQVHRHVYERVIDIMSKY